MKYDKSRSGVYPIWSPNEVVYKSASEIIGFVDLQDATIGKCNTTVLIQYGKTCDTPYYIITLVQNQTWPGATDLGLYLYNGINSSTSKLQAGIWNDNFSENYVNKIGIVNSSGALELETFESTFLDVLTSVTYDNKTYYTFQTTNTNTEAIVISSLDYDHVYINGEEVIEINAGGAGSGYIGNPLLSNKKMVGYNVPTSSSADTKTLSTDVFNSVATYDVPKEGNGYARIRYLRKTNIPEEYAYISNINELWTWYNDNYDDHVNFYEYSTTFIDVENNTYTNANPKLYTHYGIYIVKTINSVEQNCHDKNFITNPDQKPVCVASLNGIMTINVDTTDPSNVKVTYSKDTSDQLDFVGYRPNDYLRIYAKRDDDIFHIAYTYEGGLGLWSTFSSLSDAIWYIYRQYSNINLIVDGVAWVNALT